MLKIKTIREEYRKIDKILQNHYNKNRSVLSEHDANLLYGARQALGWLLKDNCCKATNCIQEPTTKP